MNFLYRVIAFVLLLSSTLNSCKSQERSPNADKELSQRKEVEIDSNAVLTSYTPYVVTKKQSMDSIKVFLGLGSMKTKAVQEEIRIWFGYAFSDSAKLVVLKKDLNKWQSSAYFFKMKPDNKGNIISLEKRVETNTPNLGWKAFLKKLSDLGIYNLKNYRKIPNYYSCSDGDEVTVEISRNDLYYMYEFPCFDAYSEKIDEVRKIKEVCLFIQKEFGYKLFPRPE